MGGPARPPQHDRQESGSSEEPGLKLEDLLARPGQSPCLSSALSQADCPPPVSSAVVGVRPTTENIMLVSGIVA